MDKELLAARFDRQVNKNVTCWIWMGAVMSAGYGEICIKRQRYLAHRLSYMLAHGPIPAGMLVLHRCDVTLCVNPEHLFLGTDADNVADKIQKSRHVKGEESHKAKLTEAKVREIRRDYVRFNLKRGNGPELALKYGVTPGTITGIVARRIWAHVK